MSSLTWAIKESLLEYLEMVEAQVEVTAGATRGEGGFTFPGVVGTELAFGGAVRMTAHGGAMNVAIARPRIVRTDEHVVLRVDTGSGEVDLARLLDYPQDDSVLRREGGTIADVALTMAGAALLGSVYAPWARVAPLVLTVGEPA